MAHAERITRLEQRAFLDMFGAVGARARERLGLSAQFCGPALVLRAQGLPHPLFNRAFGLHADGGAPSSALVDSLVGRFRAQGIERYFVQVGDGPETEPLREQLLALGLSRFARSWHALARGPGALITASSDVEVVPATHADTRWVGATLCRGFDVPAAGAALFASVVGRRGWHAFIGRIAGVPAGAGLLYVDGRAAYLAAGVTLPEYRNRGVQGALMHVRIATALRLGCDLVASTTGEAMPGEPNPSYHNMLRHGLRPVSVTENWAPPDLPRFAHAPARTPC